MNIGMIAGAFEGILKGLDGLFTSDDERLTAKGKIIALQGQVMSAAMEYEATINKQKSNIIIAEAQGSSWLQRNWRPLMMVTFGVIIVAKWFGFTDENISEALELKLMSIIQIGLGGYIVGRSAEKIAKSVDFKTIRAKDK